MIRLVLNIRKGYHDGMFRFRVDIHYGRTMVANNHEVTHVCDVEAQVIAARQWCEKQFDSGTWLDFHRSGTFFFQDEAQVVAFKIRWT